MHLLDHQPNKPGYSVRQLEARRTSKALGLAFLSVLLAVLAIVLLFFSPVAVLLAAPLVFLSIFVGTRLNQQSLLVYNARRGAQAEEKVGECLDNLPGWRVFHNVLLPEIGDIDHLAVGPGGIVLVETKSQRGTLVVSRGRIGFKQPLGTRWSGKNLAAQTRALSEALQQKGLAVTAFLCFPFAQVTPLKVKGIPLVDLKALLTAIEQLPQTYTDAEVTEICERIDAGLLV
ncbi:nuclease-related domain-containing protein [Candidatus Cyanaurora vandensis]|uniref:nuclease-related domain-containing protein n=1 Tax=Candidatus Cyanaurora vandensis TaxID=2714958 RepID=UPI00257B2796|nr:nuclease-related domain-containing protein [Candidatus Cyanaurora vandensis]